jgi:hypothetical protein
LIIILMEMEGKEGKAAMEVVAGGGPGPSSSSSFFFGPSIFPLIDRASIVDVDLEKEKSLTGTNESGSGGTLGVRFLTHGGWLVDAGQWPPVVHLLVPPAPVDESASNVQVVIKGGSEKEKEKKESIGNMKGAFLDRGRIIVSIPSVSRT